MPETFAIDVNRLLAQTFLAEVEPHVQVDSTQSRAHELMAADPGRALPLLVTAERQTTGRGRGSNTWWTGAGSLAFSLVFDPAMWGLEKRAQPSRSLAAALALADAVQPWLAGHAVGLHWPNDLFVADRKLSGVLVDVLPSGIHILGVGLNTNNLLEEAPEELRHRVATLRELTGRTFDHTQVLIEILKKLSSVLRHEATNPHALGLRFHDLCLQVGQTLTIATGQERISGKCRGIATDGALLIDTPEGTQKIYSGVLVK